MPKRKKPRVEHRSKKTGGRDNWGTPAPLVKALEGIFGKFTIDLAASKRNAVCRKFIDKKKDFFKYVFSKEKGVGFLNPPYSEAKKFIARAAAVSHSKFKVVVLIASRTDTDMFHQSVRDYKCKSVVFIAGRIRFKGAKDSAPFPSVLFVFGGESELMSELRLLNLTPKQRGF